MNETKYTVQLDDKSIETVKGMHSEFFANEKNLIEESPQKMEKILSQHREKLKRIKDGESAWISFKAWVWAIILFEFFLFAADLEALVWAGTCVLVLPCGRSAHTEAGWMAGAGKRVIACIPEMVEPELMYKLFDQVVGNLGGLVKCFWYNGEIKGK